MSEREDALAGLRAQAGGIDPIVDEKVKYMRGLNAVREVVAEQGQVMSAALANSQQLWNERKQLIARTGTAEAQSRYDRQRAEKAERELAELRASVDKLGGADLALKCSLLEQQNAGLKAALDQILHRELDAEGRKSAMAQLAAQQKEIDELGLGDQCSKCGEKHKVTVPCARISEAERAKFQ